MAFEVIQRIYDEANERVVHWPFGFDILYGPPRHRPEAVFIGIHPGGDETHRRERRTWPEANELVDGRWAYARALRTMFTEPFVADSVGLNAIFLRYPDDTTFRRAMPLDDRREHVRWCVSQARRIVDVLDPRQVICIGLGALKLFGDGNVEARGRDGDALVASATVDGRRFLGTKHLSAARIARGDRQRIQETLEALR